jgi:beta-ketodecanoyl-[acyl-carrier-protein] synthase
MNNAAVSGTGVIAPRGVLTNDELAFAYNQYADIQNSENARAIADGTQRPLKHTSAENIFKTSGIERRFVVDKAGVLDPFRMTPKLPARPNDELSLMAEMGVAAAKKALSQAEFAAEHVDLVICAASNFERAYPSIGAEIQNALGAGGFAFDMNVACSSATFAIQIATDLIRTGTIRSALVVSPEICSAHLEWRDRDCNFIFGDVATAILLQRQSDAKVDHFKVRSFRGRTQFSNNIRNNNGFLRRSHDQMEDRRDMQFMQHGRRVFKEVLPLVVAHIHEHLAEDGLTADDMDRLWLHQANAIMNEFIGKSVLNRMPRQSEMPNILRDYGNTSSAGSIVAFSKHSNDLASGDLGMICSFGAGYSVGSVILERCA